MLASPFGIFLALLFGE